MKLFRLVSLIVLGLYGTITVPAANYTCYATSVGAIARAARRNPSPAAYAKLTGLNNSGQAVGTFYYSTDIPFFGFSLSAQRGIFLVEYPGAAWTMANTINNLGEIAGTYADALGTTHGFIRKADGSYINLTNPGSPTSSLNVYGINDADDVSANVGNHVFVMDKSGNIVNELNSEAFVPAVGSVNNSRVFAYLDLRGGGADLNPDGTTLFSNFPGIGDLQLSAYSNPWGLNNSNTTAGFWQPRGGDATYSFVHSGAAFPSVTCPGYETDGIENKTMVYAINDSGMLAGNIVPTNFAVLSFIATPTTLAPGVLLSNTQWQFAAHGVGETSGPGTIYVTNTGNAPLHLPNLVNAPFFGTNAAEFSVTNTTCPLALMVGRSCQVSFVFKPQAPGWRTASLVLADDAPDGPHAVSVGGSGLAQMLLFKPASWTFGGHPVGETSGQGKIFVTNSSKQAVTISNVSLLGANPTDFAITGGSCVGSLAAGATCNTVFTFTPIAKGLRTAILVFNDNAPMSPQSIPLSGYGQ